MSKAALKAAKSALDSGSYDEAVTQSKTVLESDPQNHFANLFLGRALEKQGRPDEAADAYRSAARIKPHDELAWKGLCGIYQSQGSQNVDKHTDASLDLAQVYAEHNDKDQCQTVINKALAFAKDHGTRAQYRHALECTLPNSPIYDFLEGRVPHPGHTFMRIAEITEADEKERINKAIGDRRMRLGARIGQVTAEVTREVYGASYLEAIYFDVVNWATNDELRRTYEEKLLQRAYDHLCVLPADAKAEKRDLVVKLARDMVIIKHPFKLAWQVELEWSDFEDISQFDKNILLEHIDFFPRDGLSLILMAHFGVGALKEKPEEHGNEDHVNGEKSDDIDASPERPKLNDEERLLLIGEGIEAAKASALARRIVSRYYLDIKEYESCVETARDALALVQAEARKSGMVLQNIRDDISSALATSLVYYQAPKNHPEAMSMFQEILQRRSQHTPALLGVGLIYEEREEFEEAVSFLDRALSRDAGNLRIRAEAAWCKALTGGLEDGHAALKQVYDDMRAGDPTTRDLRALTSYRIGKCSWDLKPDKSSRKSRQGPYANFLSAIKIDPNLAPPYTSLGFYYADYARDRKRARQCFQKAFELSAAEVDAAERLARDFAQDRDWDIVEVIAQRVIDSGVVRPPPGSKRRGYSWPFAALGVVQMNRSDFPAGVVSFQSALCIAPKDYNSWVGLGESYHSSGRYNAARRALEHALALNAEQPPEKQEDGWFARYMLANVQRELGNFGDATEGYRAVLKVRSAEFGVSIALLQTLVEHASSSIENGFFGFSAARASSAIEHAADMVATAENAFNFWKAIGDACTIFARVPGLAEKLPVSTLHKITESIRQKAANPTDSIDAITPESVLSSERGSEEAKATSALDFAILAHKVAISVVSHDIHAQAVAWYNLGCTEFWAAQSRKVDSAAKKGHRLARAAVTCFKRAIELEASNAEFWSALGAVTMQLNPKVSQHSFVRSLNLNERSAKTWTNLGVLYLLQNDHELAHEAFSRAQSTDPDYAYAWVGEGLLALLSGSQREALIHFTHAVDIADATVVVAKGQFVASAFDGIVASAALQTLLPDLTQPIFGAQQLLCQAPQSSQFRHLLGLLQERAGDYAAAVENLSMVAEHAESRYEESESSVSLGEYIRVKADLSRCQLAIEAFDAAAENAETVLDLSAEPDESAMAEEERRKSRLSAHLTAGIAHFKRGEAEQALEMFQAALDESDQAPDIVCVLAQVLWAKGSKEEKDIARDRLFESAEKHAGHAGVTVLLGAIAVADNDQDTGDAVASDLKGLRTSSGQSAATLRRIDDLMRRLSALKGDDARQEAAASAALLPGNASGWTRLADLTGDSYAREMAVEAARRSIPPHGDTDTEDLASALAGLRSASHAQRAVALCPWMPEGYASFAAAVTS